MPRLEEVADAGLAKRIHRRQKRQLIDSVRKENGIIERGSQSLLSFSCNDYLGLSHDRRVKTAAIDAIEKYGAGAGASRLVTGNHPLYTQLEQKLAAWKHCESALVFGSGYMANIGIIPALVNTQDLIIADKLVHACLIDGARLSGAKLLRFKHNDVADCSRLLENFRAKHRYCLIITDEVFSMDGDKAPLAALRALADQHDAWLMADSAHSIMPSHVPLDINMGTLSKAFGGYGGYVCAKQSVIDYLTSEARSLIFTTALPPSVIASAIVALDIIQENPELALQPLHNAKIFTDVLGLPEAQSPIVPLILGAEEKALAASKLLAEHGYLVIAIRPPTVPEGTSRLRFAFSALHTEKDILAMTDIIKDHIRYR